MKRFVFFAVLLLVAVLTLPEVDASARRHNFIKNSSARAGKASVRNSVPSRGIASISPRLKPGFDAPLGLEFDEKKFFLLTPSEQLEYFEILVELSYHMAKHQKHFGQYKPLDKILEDFLFNKAHASTSDIHVYDILNFTNTKKSQCANGFKPCPFFYGLNDKKNALCYDVRRKGVASCIAVSSTKNRTNLRDEILDCRKKIDDPNCRSFIKDIKAHTQMSRNYCVDNMNAPGCRKALRGLQNLSKDVSYFFAKTVPDDVAKKLDEAEAKGQSGGQAPGQGQGQGGQQNGAGNQQPQAGGSQQSDEKGNMSDDDYEKLKKMAEDLNKKQNAQPMPAGKSYPDPRSCNPAASEIMSRQRRKAYQNDANAELDQLLALTPGTSVTSRLRQKNKSMKDKLNFMLPKYEKEYRNMQREFALQRSPKVLKGCYALEDQFSNSDVLNHAREVCSARARVGRLRKLKKGPRDSDMRGVHKRWRQLVELAQQGCPGNRNLNFSAALNRFGACVADPKKPEDVLKYAQINEEDKPKEPKKESMISRLVSGKDKWDVEEEYEKAMRAYRDGMKNWNALRERTLAENSEKQQARQRWNPNSLTEPQKLAVLKWRQMWKARAKGEEMKTPEMVKHFKNATGMAPEEFTNVFCNSANDKEFYLKASSRPLVSPGASPAQVLAATYFKDCVKQAFNEKKKRSKMAANKCKLVPITDPEEILLPSSGGPVVIRSKDPGAQACFTVDKVQAEKGSLFKHQVYAKKWPLGSGGNSSIKKIDVDLKGSNFDNFNKNYMAYTYRCEKYETGFDDPKVWPETVY